MMSDQEDGEIKCVSSHSQSQNEALPNELMKKLDIIKDIKFVILFLIKNIQNASKIIINRNKTTNLQKIKQRLKQELTTVEDETKCVENFHSELELLCQEKLAQVEELKQIQNDIDEVCSFSRYFSKEFIF